MGRCRHSSASVVLCPPPPRVPIQQYFYLGHTLLGLPTTRSCGSFMIFNVSYNNYLSKWFSLTKLLFPFYKVHENAYASYFHHCFSVQQNSSGTKHILWIVFLGYSSTSVATSSQIITGRSKLPCSQLITGSTELFKQTLIVSPLGVHIHVHINILKHPNPH